MKRQTFERLAGFGTVLTLITTGLSLSYGSVEGMVFAAALCGGTYLADQRANQMSH